jgi:hypothetical protein
MANNGKRQFLNADPATLPYSERKAMQPAMEWPPLELQVHIQRLACAGYNADQIVQQTGAAPELVSRLLSSDPMPRPPGAPRAPWAPDPPRQQRRGDIDIEGAKAYWRGSTAKARERFGPRR